jgi:hypothetical protein
MRPRALGVLRSCQHFVSSSQICHILSDFLPKSVSVLPEIGYGDLESTISATPRLQDLVCQSLIFLNFSLENAKRSRVGFEGFEFSWKFENVRRLVEFMVFGYRGLWFEMKAAFCVESSRNPLGLLAR